MRTIRLIKPHDKRPAGTIIEVSNNAAHDLIEQGVGVLVSRRELTQAMEKPPKDKQLRPGKKGARISTK